MPPEGVPTRERTLSRTRPGRTHDPCLGTAETSSARLNKASFISVSEETPARDERGLTRCSRRRRSPQRRGCRSAWRARAGVEGVRRRVKGTVQHERSGLAKIEAAAGRKSGCRGPRAPPTRAPQAEKEQNRVAELREEAQRVNGGRRGGCVNGRGGEGWLRGRASEKRRRRNRSEVRMRHRSRS